MGCAPRRGTWSHRTLHRPYQYHVSSSEIEIEARRTFAADKQPDALLLGVLLELRVRHDLGHGGENQAPREGGEKDVDGAGKQQSWSRKQTEDGRSFKSRDPMNGRAFSHLFRFAPFRLGRSLFFPFLSLSVFASTPSGSASAEGRTLTKLSIA